MSANLELRKAALLASGWTVTSVTTNSICGDYLVLARPDGKPQITMYSEPDFWPFAPAVESDPGISEPWFMEWCLKNDWFFTLRNDALDDPVSLHIFKQEDDTPHFRVSGATPSEVRARAVIAATGKPG